MNPRRFALVGGWVMLLMGMLAFIPALYESSSYTSATGLLPLEVNTSYGLFLDVFPMNIFNKVVLIIFGLAGIAASRDRALVGTQSEGILSSNVTSIDRVGPEASSVLWSRVVCVMMGVLAVLGVVPATRTLFGIWPLYGAEVALHGIFAILGAYFGFSRRMSVGVDIDRSDADWRRAA